MMCYLLWEVTTVSLEPIKTVVQMRYENPPPSPQKKGTPVHMHSQLMTFTRKIS